MYSEKDLLRVLRRDLVAEFKTILFYLDNAKELNYDMNKRAVDLLTLDSVEHAREIVAEMLEHQKGKTFSQRAAAGALKEELALKELYHYELNRVKGPSAKKVLVHLMKEEQRHVKIVKALKT